MDKAAGVRNTVNHMGDSISLVISSQSDGLAVRDGRLCRSASFPDMVLVLTSVLTYKPLPYRSKLRNVVLFIVVSGGCSL